MLEVDRELYETLHDNGPLNNIPQELLISLEKSNFICDDNLDETMIFISKNRVTRFSNEHIRVTIMPTLNCNFRCWYCYEEHFHSQMSPEIRNASIKFCKKLIDKYNPKLFSLDWFGGEPLLYFDEIMYPIAKEIMNYCDEKRIPFSHGITTNGYLIDEDKIEKFKYLRLKSFQITLDGSEKYHNRTRFSTTDKNTYTKLVTNITKLVRHIDSINMMVRINYTPTNIDSIDQIADSFPEDIRAKLEIVPQIVWQYKNIINPINDIIHNKLKIFSDKGYIAEKIYIKIPDGTCCYTEKCSNM